MWLMLIAALMPFLDDRPLAEDLQRFPPAEVCQQILAASQEYQRHVEMRKYMASWQYREWTVVAAEARCCHEAWDWLYYAHLYPGYRRTSLARLRELIGPEAYYAGRMPPCVPVWRFAWRH